MASGMGSLYIGVTGLQSSQNALNVTAHNLANVETNGYVRQQVVFADKTYLTAGRSYISASQVGSGVGIAEVRQVRQTFYDEQYREGLGHSTYYKVNYGVVSELENLYQEPDGASFTDAMSAFKDSIQELAKDPSDSVRLDSFILSASNFLERADAIYKGMCEYQDNLNMQAKGKIEEINKYGKIIDELNRQISGIEMGVENANDLRDKRNIALDELSKLGNITYNEDESGMVTVRFEGTVFVSTDRCFEMETTVDLDTGFITPIWKHTKENVFSTTETVSAVLGNDSGELKALIRARGDHRADYTELVDENGEPNEEAYSKISGSVVMKKQAEFDQLIHGMVTAINDVLCGYGNVDGNPDGSAPVELFIRNGNRDRYEAAQNADGEYVCIGEDYSKKNTLYSIGNLMLNPKLVKDSSLLNFKDKEGNIQSDKVNAMLDTWNQEFATLNPDSKAKMNFDTYYQSLTDDLANFGKVYGGLYSGQLKEVYELDNKRQTVIGVSSDEELTNMIMYQNAYNASSRYINAVSEMLEHLINALGR